MTKPAVTATLVIEVRADCPNCGELIDLLRPRDTSGTDHNEECHVVSQACPEGSWSEKHEHFEVLAVQCTSCSGVFDVRGLEW